MWILHSGVQLPMKLTTTWVFAAIALCSGCATTRSTLQLLSGHDLRPVYTDSTWRTTRWAADGPRTIIVAERLTSGGRLYEPLPAWERFARLVVLAGDQPPRLIISSPNARAVLHIDSMDPAEGALKIRASNDTLVVTLTIVGRPNANYSSLCKETRVERERSMWGQAENMGSELE